MTTLEEIIEEGRLDAHPQKEFPSFEVMVRPEMPKLTSHGSLEDLAVLCREMEFPVIEERMLDNSLALLDVLNNLNIEYGRYGLSFSDELNELKEKEERISLYNECEEKCDILEVELANLKQEYDKMCQYSQYEVEELRTRLDELRTMSNDMQHERQYFRLMKKISAFLSEEGSVDEEIVASLSYVKETKEYLNIIERMTILDEIESLPDSYDKLIFKRLISEESIALDDLGSALGVDRSSILKTIYTLLSMNIVAFDRSRDTISLQR